MKDATLSEEFDERFSEVGSSLSNFNKRINNELLAKALDGKVLGVSTPYPPGQT